MVCWLSETYLYIVQGQLKVLRPVQGLVLGTLLHLASVA